MNTFTVSIVAENTLVALQRVIGILSRGRIDTSAVQFQADTSNQTCAISFSAACDPLVINRLRLQVEKIVEVRAVEVL